MTEFWDIVGERTSPDALNVGDAARVEWNKQQFIVIVIDKWVDPVKGTQIRFRPATPDDTYDATDLITLVAE